MRIGVAGFSIEACSFSPLDTTYEDFAMVSGEQLLDRVPHRANYPGVQFIPLLKARSIPAGAVQREAFEKIKLEIVSQIIKNMPLDGLYLDMHGAGFARGMEDLEGTLYGAVREAVGPQCFVAASYDLHGNISPNVFSQLDVISAYRTAPHEDAEETRDRTLRIMVRCMTDGYRPAKAWISLPLILPGEVTSTAWDPGKRLYAALPKVSDATGILDASLLMGYPWVDEPRSGASVLVYGTDINNVKSKTRLLATHLWDARHQFDFGVPTFAAEECVERAMAEPDGPVFISDSGDNPTAGGPGDTTGVLRALLDRQAEDVVFTCIPDAKAVQCAVAAGKGRIVAVSLGGKLDPIHSEPLDVEGTVERIYHNVDAAGRANTIVLLRSAGCTIVVAEQRTPFLSLKQFNDIGIDITKCKIVVVKLGYLEPDFAHAAKAAYLALSPGAVDQRLSELPYRRIRRPSFPMDPETEADIEALLMAGDTQLF